MLMAMKLCKSRDLLQLKSQVKSLTKSTI